MLPTSTNVTVDVKSITPGYPAVFIQERPGAHSISGVSSLASTGVKRLIAAGVAKGKAREVHFDLMDSGKGKPTRVYVVGVGKASEVTTDVLRQAGGALAKALRKHGIDSVGIYPPKVGTVSEADAAGAIVSGMLLASFQYKEYQGAIGRKKEQENGGKSKSLAITVVSDSKEVRAEVERARVMADAQNFARTIAFRPGNNINPPALAEVARELAREAGLDIRVLDQKQMKKLGMGGILAVGSGSATPPRMIILQHRPGGIVASRARAKIGKRLPIVLVVGKSITFDTGGISIKPAEKMGEMVFDKCGGMAVLGLMYAAAKLRLPAHVVGILSSAENMPGSRAYRPGDILRMHNGVTVEVTNTDAEGRLVLADALAWGIETFKPAAVVDLATLTGGVVTALGSSICGVMSTDDPLFAALQKAADRAGEKIWRLPISDDVRDQIKSHTADIVNSAGRQASPLQGSEFLRCFVPEGTPWAHFDIAGVADTDKELPYYGKGATGWGVRMLVEWISGERRSTSL